MPYTYRVPTTPKEEALQRNLDHFKSPQSEEFWDARQPRESDG
jgi:hypothetical protein